MPILELWVIIQIGGEIGVLPTIAILIADSILGSMLMRSQGRAAWRRFNEALAAGRPPAREVIDGALVIFGGALLLTPGFVTDVFGAAPAAARRPRAAIRRLLVRHFARAHGDERLGLLHRQPRRRGVSFRRAGRARRPGRPAATGAPRFDVEGTATEVDPPQPSVSVGTEAEAPRRLEGAQSEAVTVAFGDPRADVYGVARVGPVAARGRAGRQRPGAAVRRRRAGRACGPRAPRRSAARAGRAPTPVACPRAVVEPLSSLDGALRVRRRRVGLHAGPAGALGPGGADRRPPGGQAGRDGRLRAARRRDRDGDAWPARSREVDCRGQRGHSWGAPDWDKLALARTVGAWLEGDSGVTITAVRPAKGSDHEGEATAAFLYEPGEDGPAAALRRCADPRLSTAYDADGRQLRAGMELYVGEDDEFAHRAAGEVVCGTTLDLGRLRLDCAFFKWRMEGREGVGRYDLLRRVD